MNKGNLSRRGFLARSVVGLTAAGLPIWFAKEIVADAQEKDAKTQKTGPNDRIVMAAIGTGTNRTRRPDNRPTQGERGYHIMQNAMGQPGVQMIAVCDVDRPNAEYAAAEVNRRNSNSNCQIFSDYRELLRNNDIQAVTIGTPDHWHAQIAIAAMEAGKDVYCEKPLTLTIDEGKAMRRVAAARHRVVQTGSQQRSEGAQFRLACELVRNNRIGRIARVTTLIGANPVGGPFMTIPPPEGLNWDVWLGPTPRADYQTQRCHYDFRWWYDYSGGKMTDWGAHHNDIAQWGLGMDDSGPIAVRGTGAAPDPRPNCFNCHPTFEAVYTYGNGPNGAPGTQLICRNGPPEDFPARNGNRPHDNGILFEGENNQWIFVNRGTIIASDGSGAASHILSDPLPQNATRLQVSTNHMANFLSCFRSRQQPITNVNVGFRSVTVCHLGNIAIRFFPNQTVNWNPQTERFTGERADQANTHLSRPRREGYRLPA